MGERERERGVECGEDRERVDECCEFERRIAGEANWGKQNGGRGGGKERGEEKSGKSLPVLSAVACSLSFCVRVFSFHPAFFT